MIAKQENAAIGIVRSIKKGENVMILVDQRDDMNGIESKFFGVKTHTNKSVYTFINRFKIPLYSLRIIRKGALTKFKLEVNEEKDIANIEDENEFIQAINNKLELWIREYPDQWFWVHDRWK